METEDFQDLKSLTSSLHQPQIRAFTCIYSYLFFRWTKCMHHNSVKTSQNVPHHNKQPSENEQDSYRNHL